MSQSLLFGLNLPTSAAPGNDPVATARQAEELGFDFVSASDHPCGANPTFETWTMLTWVAASTTSIRIATRVLGVPYRNPALLAKMAESLDRLSGGRLILGLGGGSSDREFRGFGIPVPNPRDKIDGLGEAVEIIRGLWSAPSLTYPGRLHHTDAAEIEPKPAHSIPIWLGTFGDRSLALTGRLADGWIPSLGYAPPDQVTVLRDKMLAAAQSSGRSPEEITCAYNIEVWVGDDAEDREDLVSGRPPEVAARLNDFRKMGFSAFNFMLAGPDPSEQAERLAREVIPEVRAMA